MPTLSQQFTGQDRQFLKSLGQAVSSAGGRAYLVGGCVRSALLREPVADFDLEVFGLGPEQLEETLGKSVEITKVGKAFGIYKLAGWPVDVGLPRIERKEGQGHRDFAIDIDPGMTIADAARRRDFTMNAIYYDILDGTLHDPLDGQRDLEDKTLRHCSSRFPEDPLRVLRAMQLSSRIPATVARETLELCRDLTPEELSPERFFGEWEKLLLGGKVPSSGLSFLKDCGWVRYFPEMQAMIGCQQDPQWHPEGDVWAHTLHCIDAFAQNRSGDREEDLAVGLAVLCHDMGKPLTSERVNGKIRSHGHESAGLKPARTFLQRLNVSNRLVELILPLIKCHMRPAVLYAQKSSASAIRRLARDCGRLDLLLRVFQADAAGRPPMQDNSNQAMAWLQEQARLLNVERSAPRAILKGADLLERGWESGPHMGKFLTLAYEAQLDGAFSTHEEAIAWLDNQSAEIPSKLDNHPDAEVS
jgi:tRNA nucleotidyltransferase (CCA-adding enzyme)